MKLTYATSNDGKSLDLFKVQVNGIYEQVGTIGLGHVAVAERIYACTTTLQPFSTEDIAKAGVDIVALHRRTTDAEAEATRLRPYIEVNSMQRRQVYALEDDLRAALTLLKTVTPREGEYPNADGAFRVNLGSEHVQIARDLIKKHGG